MIGLFGTFDYDNWLATESDYGDIEQTNEDEEYDRWMDDHW